MQPPSIVQPPLVAPTSPGVHPARLALVPDRTNGRDRTFGAEERLPPFVILLPLAQAPHFSVVLRAVRTPRRRTYPAPPPVSVSLLLCIVYLLPDFDVLDAFVHRGHHAVVSQVLGSFPPEGMKHR